MFKRDLGAQVGFKLIALCDHPEEVFYQPGDFFIHFPGQSKNNLRKPLEQFSFVKEFNKNPLVIKKIKD